MTKLRTLTLAAAAVAALASTAAAERGTDGELKMLYWQAPSILNPYLSGGTKDTHAASLILEPLARYDENGDMVPWLAAGIPTLDNGGVAQDLMSITWTLRADVVWSDGTPFTAEDVAFTAAYCMDPNGGCSSAAAFQGVAGVTAVDDHTVRIDFDVPMPFPYAPFVGSILPILQKQQFEPCIGARAPECTDENFAPIGTGPYQVDEFRPNDVVRYVVNERYRNPDQPAFSSVLMKGGGDAVSAARAVLVTGEFDYAWNLQVEPEILADMERSGKGEVLSAFGTFVERLEINLTNPDPALGDTRSTHQDGANPHPFLADPVVVRALSLAIDRDILVEAGYGPAGRVTCNVLPAPPVYASTANDWCLTQDIDEANRLLDEAGWERGRDDVRAKDGVRLSILYQTSTNSVRQGTQALVKQMWREIGVETELRNISASVFFGSDPGQPRHLPEVLRRHPDVHRHLRRHRPAGVHGRLGLRGDPRPREPVARQQHRPLLQRGVRRPGGGARGDRRHRAARGDRQAHERPAHRGRGAGAADPSRRGRRPVAHARGHASQRLGRDPVERQRVASYGVR